MVLSNPSVGKTHYEIIGVNENASQDEIRRTYRSAILNFHPDKQLRSSESEHDSGNQFLEVQTAWEILGDPRSRALYDNDLRKLRHDGLNADDVSLVDMVVEDVGGKVERLTGTEIIPPGTDPETGVLCKDVTNIIPDTQQVYARIYLPKHISADNKLPLLVYFHGGGFMIESPASPTYHNYLNTLVAQSNVIAVSVNYRKAPEFPIPIAYEDSWAVLQWVASHRDGPGPEEFLNRHADFGRLFLSGDSAGGNIAHNMAMKTGDHESRLNILGIALVDPYFWGSNTVGSEGRDPGKKAYMDKLWPFLSPSLGADDSLINPMAEGGPSLVGLGCKRVLVLVAEKDLLKDRGWLYTRVLSESGWKGTVEIDETEGEGHVFHLFDSNREKARERMKRMVEFFNRDVPTLVRLV